MLVFRLWGEMEDPKRTHTDNYTTILAVNDNNLGANQTKDALSIMLLTWHSGVKSLKDYGDKRVNLVVSTHMKRQLYLD